ncbi:MULTISPECIES: hypothetical protein [unclassified Microbacterium]|nr:MULTISPECIES: hypothetical protein [unclassified Microbacterium]MDH5134612.1 hypothetical protein [Microbacterium sp. RD10]MDH5138166.1 hypothetical protein [Microbacterium sp. RD11]MDH5146114.1 hypothetical protein [Microbacterium sp. RD12]MDH5156163.1 hypothetical protein [Microbacterium sp. RD06]MDH5168001.1 hypothetical protein [Microbacterium sp. RD02]
MNAAPAPTPVEDGTLDRLVAAAPPLSTTIRARLTALLAPAPELKR